MYNNKLVTCIKVAGKVLREQNDTVKLPFGSEYSVYLKNLDSVKILAKVEIDGQDVGDGTQFIVPANGTIDIERFIKNGNFGQGNKLKFIERSSGIEKHRGIMAEDGLIRVEFQFEKRIEIQTHDVHHLYNHYYPHWSYPYYGPYYGGGYWGHTSTTFGISSNNVNLNNIGTSSIDMNFSVNSMTDSGEGICSASAAASGSAESPTMDSYSSTLEAPTKGMLRSRSINNVQLSSTPVNDTGITVPGSVSNQQFQQGAWFAVEEQKHVIVLKLLGETEHGYVEKAVTVKQKLRCTSCGRYSKSNVSFCGGCGTSLQIC